MQNRASQTAPEVIHRGARLVISGGGVGEEVGGVESGAVPQLIEVSVKSIGTGLRDVVDLRSAVSALVDRVGDRVDRHLRNRIQSEHEIGRKSAVEVGQRIVGLQSV